MSYRVALVEYLNTFPFSEGFRLSGLDQQLEVHHVIPAECARLFKEDLVDISLCPVGALDEMPEHKIVGKYCIGAEGEVGTVVLLSQVPIEQIRKIKLDNHSRTSNILLQMLAQFHWKKEWAFTFESNGVLPESSLMIGDKVFAHKEKYVYSYDLATAWKEMTGLPMVFAVWIAKNEVPQEIIDSLDHAFELGMDHVRSEANGLEKWQKDYLLNSISYPLDEEKMKALRLFRSMIS